MWRLGTRRSKLAIKQVEEFINYFPDEKFEIVFFDTTGDIDKIKPISSIEGWDFFTDKIDKALLEGRIDLALHSAKDLPDRLPNGLIVAFMTKSICPYDVLVAPKGLSYGARVGVSSKRRKEQIKEWRPDLKILDIRGNIDERLEKLDSGSYDAIVVAEAGLIRLGLQHRITQRLPFQIHPLQGRLAVVVRSSDYGKGLFSWCRAR